MSQVKISGNASGTGILTVAAPNTNSNYTLTLPAETGTVLSSASNSNFPAGSVLQVVSANYSTQSSTTSTSGTDTGLSASITPSSASNKILVLHGGATHQATNPSLSGPSFWLTDGSNNILSNFGLNGGGFGTSSAGNWSSYSMAFLHSPNTTSSFTYKIRVKTYNASSTIYWCWNDTEMNLTLLEIAA